MLALRVGVFALVSSAFAVGAFAQATTMESVDAHGLWGGSSDLSTSSAYVPGLSGDGRYVAWVSADTNFVAGDVNASTDTFVRDRTNGAVECVSVGPNGITTPGDSLLSAISSDGRYVLFYSDSSALVSNDTNGDQDGFLRDRWLGTTERVTLGSGGVQANDYGSAVDVSDDGRWVLLLTTASNFAAGDPPFTNDVFLRDRANDVTTLISADLSGNPGTAHSIATDLSPDGRFVAFYSFSSTLVPGDTNGKVDVFVRDVQTGNLERASVDSAGVEGDRDSWYPVLSADGRFVAFESRSNNLVPNDTNSAFDIFLRDRLAGSTTRISVDSLGGQANGGSNRVRITPDGRWLAFETLSTNLVPNDTNGFADVMLHDRANGATTRVSLGWTGLEPDAHSYDPRISDDGRLVAFTSNATTLTANDRIAADVYLRDTQLVATPIAIYCTTKQNSAGCTPKIGATGAPRVSGPDAFFVWAYDVLPQKSGLLFWGLQPHGAPFLGGTLCVKPPLVRSPVMSTHPLVGLWSCDAAYSYQFRQSEMASHGLSAGDTLHAQFWGRDPGFAPPDNVSLSDAIRFTLVH
ncbi:MAG: PD40 domain-containing protein [Planctomycetes bacterium]|nr:PD40 domain-containing protein [Planctomycetota bacterium]